MGRTTCAEPECLYKGDLYLTSVPVQGSTFTLKFETTAFCVTLKYITVVFIKYQQSTHLAQFLGYVDPIHILFMAKYAVFQDSSLPSSQQPSSWLTSGSNLMHNILFQ
jgi:hypothetical protein